MYQGTTIISRFSQFYRKFIPNFAQLAQPLYNLLKKDTPYNWDNLCQNSLKA